MGDKTDRITCSEGKVDVLGFNSACVGVELRTCRLTRRS
jgi:hypothetical protein